MLEVIAMRKVGDRWQQYTVKLNGYDRLTPAAARGALTVAFGGVTGGGEVLGDDYGYRVYPNSVRKIYP